MNFQDVIFKLEKYWGSRDCVIHQPYDIEAGAGTFNPATFFRVLGPEPYRAAYVEPSRRPTDGRYGENPNRLQHYYQYQVILKPSPEDVQEQYLDSLKALGIDPLKHDIRFVEDDWESPTLGAWGLGWEVWLDGMEITQFTYFQQVGSIDLDPVSVELTYGLERITMYLQNVDNVYDLQWNDTVKYGHVHLETEKQFSKYNFEVSDKDRLVPVVRYVRGRGEGSARAGPDPSRLRLHPEMLACLQSAGRARGHQRDRAYRLHRAGAQAGAAVRRRLRPPARRTRPSPARLTEYLPKKPTCPTRQF